MMVTRKLFQPGIDWLQFPRHRVHFFTSYPDPFLEIQSDDTEKYYVPFVRVGPGRRREEQEWQADFRFPLPPAWDFRILWENGRVEKPKRAEHFTTRLRSFWLQDGELFAGKPAAAISPSRVLKINHFQGSLITRPLYIYLPRGYDEHPQQSYPVLYMHDGQNCFAQFAHDSYAGSWKADLTADRLIALGQMRECIIVGVSNGREERLTEYLPPPLVFNPSPTRRNRKGETLPPQIIGQADKTARYYREEVAPFMAGLFRVQSGRDHTATCGSSMGGLFTTYLAWEHDDFARHHAALSPSYWVTQTRDNRFKTIEYIQNSPRPDIRFWLDSGTQNSPGRGYDARFEVLALRDTLLHKGFTEGDDFQCVIDEDGIHDEASWGRRLSQVLPFLFPVDG
ncbi:MAG: alpha/beta hydrolase [Chloroflexi bacterium]|nr:alpha/beta hydrolase [Chloroflexota bacterium]MBP8058842.1 alpha/beta hydrolase [Chloroflexota bacterium]